jgi:hypothetical protein
VRGLEPLGDLCLWDALIVSFAAIYLGSWLIVSPDYAYLIGFFHLLWILVPFAAIGFVLPLWNTHKVMVAKRKELLDKLDELAEQIGDEWRDVLESVHKLTPDESGEKLKRLELMQQIYHKQKKARVWPINTSIGVKFATSQVVPLLGLTGLGPKIVDAISGL